MIHDIFKTSFVRRLWSIIFEIRHDWWNQYMNCRNLIVDILTSSLIKAVVAEKWTFLSLIRISFLFCDISKLSVMMITMNKKLSLRISFVFFLISPYNSSLIWSYFDKTLSSANTSCFDRRKPVLCKYILFKVANASHLNLCCT